MKFGIRKPSLKKMVNSRLSIKRVIGAKIRIPKIPAIITNPKKVIYNKVYNKTSISALALFKKIFK